MGRVRGSLRLTAAALAASLVAGALAVGAGTAALAQEQIVSDGDAHRLTYVATRLSFGGARETVTQGRDVVVTIAADVLFDFDSAALSDEAAGVLARTADELSAQATGTISVVGHTDDQGSRDYNQRLSEDRARAVADALLASVAGLDLAVEGRAFDEPAVEGRSDDARRANRRVEIRYQTD